MQIIDGKEVAANLRKEIAAEVEQWIASGHRRPHLVAILVGNDGASQTYVGHKEKCCGEVGFRSTVLRMPEETTEETLLNEIARLNSDPEVDGFIVQLPLPKHISEQKVIEAIDPKKDVDGFHPVNTGRMISGLPAYLPATPDGILELLDLGVQTLGDLHRKLRVEELTLHVCIGGSDDPAAAAMRYGRAWAAIGAITPALDRLFVIKKRDIQPALDYNETSMKVDARLITTITIGRSLALALHAGVRFLKILNQRKKAV